jgi:hypothetical protein
MTRVCLLFVACLIAMAGSGCTNNPTTPTPTPTPTPTILTEVFSGTINMNGAASHSFVSQASGEVRVTLTALSPDPTQIVGLSLGTWTGVACQAVVAADRASQLTSITGAVQTSTGGSLCARVYDVGTIAAGSPVTYTVTVNHP